MESELSEYVEVDPTGRYGRYNEILGKGACKIVYRAFDEYEGIEVAWNQVKLTDFLHSPEDLERLYSEINLLRTLNHKHIMKFYSSWVDTPNRNINFVTEMFTSGTLRQYRLKHKRVNIRAVKHWCRQILKGLVYLHSLDPPVIHRDLKCDNIFINGNQGQVKIGDLGLAAILRKSYAAHCVGTPEFMAPEVYKEEYNELVDIYSFGMCVLEMVTFEYPYSECTHPAQIYKKVISGTKPDSLYKVKDPVVRQFIEKCLVTVSRRLPASELLRDPFLQTDGYRYDVRQIDYHRDYDEMESVVQSPFGDRHPGHDSLTTSFSDYVGYEPDHDLDYETEGFGTSEIDHFFMSPDQDHLPDVDIAIKGKKDGDGNIFFRLRTIDKEGHVRNIYFPFDIENDTALSVATEMVAELDIITQDATGIADMIDGEIASLVPDWNKGVSAEEEEDTDFISSDNPTSQNLQVLHCSGHTCTHGRFEEVTYQVEATEQSDSEGAPAVAASSSQSDETNCTDSLAQQDESSGSVKQLSLHTGDEIGGEDENGSSCKPCSLPDRSAKTADHENQIQKELRWLKAKYEMQLRELRDQELGVRSGGFGKGPGDGRSPSMVKFRNCATPRRSYFGPRPSLVLNGKNFDKEALLPHSLHRATSLPVDAVDC